MKSVLVHRVVEVKLINTQYGQKYLADLELIDEGKVQFWMSVKQGRHLSDCAEKLKNGYSTKQSELHVVIDDAGGKLRYVWSGVHRNDRSDIPFLQDKFGVVCESKYIGIADAAPREAEAFLKDE